MIMVVLMASAYAAAQPATSIVRKFAENKDAEFVTMDVKLFNFARPFMHLDKKTKKIFNALNIKNVDVLNMKNCADEFKSAAYSELSSFSDGDYLRGSTFRPEQAVDGSDFLMKCADGKVSEFLIYSTTEAGDFVIMRIDCNADIKELEEALSL